MKENILDTVAQLIKLKKIEKAQMELSRLGPEFFKNTEYLYLRSKIFYINKLYYIAIDTLLIALEFETKDKFYDLIAKIYYNLGNKDLSKKVTNKNTRVEAINTLKSELTGISQKEE